MKSNSIGKSLCLALIIGILSLSLGCGNTVPPSKVVVIKDSGGEVSVIKDGNYNAYGRDLTIFIDSTINEFKEDEMHVLCKDNIPVILDIRYIGQFDVHDDKTIGKILSLVKSSPTADPKIFNIEFSTLYKGIIQGILRSATRSVVVPYVTDNLQNLRDPIEKALNERVIAELSEKGLPSTTLAIKVADLDYEEKIKGKKTAIKNAELDDLQKAAEAQARTREAERQAEIAIKEGEAEVERARATAKANSILDASLSPRILALEQYRMYEAMANGPNNTFMLAPYDALTSKNFGPVVGSAMLYKQTCPSKE